MSTEINLAFREIRGAPISGLSRATTMKRIRTVQELEAAVAEVGADVISVDMFDTIVFRQCAEPSSVFLLQHRAATTQAPNLTEEAWLSLRKQQEHRLRLKLRPAEVHLDEIYAGIAQAASLETSASSRMKQAELAAEEAMIVPYTDVIDILRRLQAAGKHIVVTTDIYLPEDFIRSRLEQMFDFDFELICSSSTGKTKESGAAFHELVRRYPQKRIVHFGDDIYSDVKRAKGTGVISIHVQWPRPSWLTQNRVFVEYLRGLGIENFSSPADTTKAGSNARDEVAWRWAIVMADFLRSADAYATRIGTQEIWFLSRDAESLFEAAKEGGQLFHGRQLRYVYTSRSAAYPIFAITAPDRFLRLFGRPPQDADRAMARNLMTAYQSFPRVDTDKILLIDFSWVGRVHLALQQAMSDVEVFGFYFSLGPDRLQEISDFAGVFMPWDGTVINQATVESLAGFLKPSCAGYRQSDDGTWQPHFKRKSRDVCPRDYTLSLRGYLKEFISAPPSELRDVSALRRCAIRQLSIFPDSVMAAAFADWSLAPAMSGSNASQLVKGGRTSWLYRVLGRASIENSWPTLAMWSISQTPTVVAVLQTFYLVSKYAQESLKMLLRRQRCTSLQKQN